MRKSEREKEHIERERERERESRDFSPNTKPEGVKD
jgi:hypothetical protein